MNVLMMFWLVGLFVPIDCTMQHEDLGVIFIKKKSIAFRSFFPPKYVSKYVSFSKNFFSTKSFIFECKNKTLIIKYQPGKVGTCDTNQHRRIQICIHALGNCSESVRSGL